MFEFNDFQTFLEKDVYLANKVYKSVLIELMKRMKEQTIKLKTSAIAPS
jgi:hypothetical protein